MAVRVTQRTHRNPGDVFVGGGRVASAAGRRGQHAQLSGNTDKLKVVVGEVSRIDRDVGGVGQQLEQLVGQPVLAGHQRRVFGTGQPLPPGNGEIIAVGEAYDSKASAKKGIASIQKNAPYATVVDLTE